MITYGKGSKWEEEPETWRNSNTESDRVGESKKDWKKGPERWEGTKRDHWKQKSVSRKRKNKGQLGPTMLKSQIRFPGQTEW